MEDKNNSPLEKFGTVLGIAPGNVPVYSNHSLAYREELPNRQAYRNYIDKIFMGYKWQCVEFARRWLYINKGYTFDDIAMAYDIFQLKHVRVAKDSQLLPLHSFKNGAKRHPEPGCLLIWDEGGEFEITGHVAIVTEVTPQFIRIAEQNVEYRLWPEGQNYARELKTKVDAEGGYWIECHYSAASILGWVIQTDDATHAEEIIEIDRQLLNLQKREVKNRGQAKKTWLNVANADEAAYVAAMGHALASKEQDEYKYFCMSQTAHAEIKRATNELHYMFMHATDYVLKNPSLLEKFCIPKALWPRLQKSWENRRNDMVTGRFDFAMCDKGLKVYEYNADSASCYMECGKVQLKWAKHFGCKDGWGVGQKLQTNLVEAWKKSGAQGILHIMQDSDLEETYHALFMKTAMEKAGIECRVIKGVAELSWNEHGQVIDASRTPIRWIWKTWAWETALDQIREQCEEDDCETLSFAPQERKSPRLVDVLLNDQVLVFEPFWTLIPSNKAILPVLWMLYPHHPYLLDSQFSLTESLQNKGYVAKPIVGRCGANIRIFDNTNSLVSETEGKFEDRDQIYQEFFRLPIVDNRYSQLCTFSVGGTYAGACIRLDPQPIVVSNSDIVTLRVVEDEDLYQ